MPSFKEVFSITWKVVISLMIVFAIVGVAYYLLTLPSQISEHSTATPTTKVDPIAEYDASDFHTKMPKSVWDKRVAWAVAHQCYFVGMSAEDVVHSLGKPSEQTDHGLAYESLSKDCIRYDGDNCVERKTDRRIVFLHKGYVSSLGKGDNCYTLNGANEFTGLRIPSEREMAAQKQASEEHAANQQRLSTLRTKCAPFENGSAQLVEQGKMELPPKECREVLDWMHDAYLDALYDLRRE